MLVAVQHDRYVGVRENSRRPSKPQEDVHCFLVCVFPIGHHPNMWRSGDLATQVQGVQESEVGSVRLHALALHSMNR
eukprot:7365692-Pyramimonas_sp.AAC.1